MQDRLYIITEQLENLLVIQQNSDLWSATNEVYLIRGITSSQTWKKSIHEIYVEMLSKK